jgi:hypothetical protein
VCSPQPSRCLHKHGSDSSTAQEGFSTRIITLQDATENSEGSGGFDLHSNVLSASGAGLERKHAKGDQHRRSAAIE